MKLAVVGAGSSRLPLMLASASIASRGRNWDVALFDTRPERIDAMLPAGLALAAECGGPIDVSVAGSAGEALEGADAMILTVRPGFEEARAADERTCVDLGVIGQETTGPAGMAFAARSIPTVTEYCRLASTVCPDCLPVVFTNPAGMVTQALHDQGFSTAVGICDSATGAARAVASREGVGVESLDWEVFGLNHLSWTFSITSGGRDVLSPALRDPAFLRTEFPWFDPGLLSKMKRVPNEYLFYFYRTDEALACMKAEPRTRGEALAGANGAMLADMGHLARRGAVTDSLARYAAYLSDRNDTYMDYARGGEPRGGHGVRDPVGELKKHVGGYAEVAMDLIGALKEGPDRRMALNVPNVGSVPWLDDGDVVETDCIAGLDGIRPRAHPFVPNEDRSVVERVKEYERLAVRSILEGSGRLAVEALATHPLVPSRDMAETLVSSLPDLRELRGRQGS